MGRYTGPKDRLSRREGVDLFGAGNKLRRLNITPGQHGPKGTRSKQTEYGKQLREKQKTKRIYGLLEKQFSGYVEKALKTKGNTTDKLFSLLETRLDNVVYRLGFTSSRPSARQIVGHRHVLVNDKKVNIPSFQVKVGDIITLTEKGKEIPVVKETISKKDVKIPEWLVRQGPVGRISRMPSSSDVTEPISAQDIVEYYSR